jgi:hypothetical protein
MAARSVLMAACFLLAGTDKRLGLMEAPVSLFPDHCDPVQSSHSIAVSESGSSPSLVAIQMATISTPCAPRRLSRRRADVYRTAASQPTLSRLEKHAGPSRADPAVAWVRGFVVPK